MSPTRVVLGSALVAAFFGAGWWTGHALQRPAPVVRIVAPEVPPSATSAAASLNVADAVSQFAGGDHAMTRAELRARLASATPAEIPGLLALVAKLPHRLDRERFRAQLLSRWAAADPAAARAWAEALPVLSERHVAVRDMIASLGKTAPEQAAAWLLAAKLDEPSRHGLVRGIISVWQALAPDQAEAWLAQIPDPDLRRSASDGFIAALAEQDPSAAFEKALAMSSERGGGNALGTAARAMVLRDPTSAAAVLARIPSGDTRNWAAIQVVDALSASDPKLAAEFALTLAAGNSRAAALNTAIHAMAADPDAAIGWIQAELPAGAERDRAIRSVVESIADDAPADALRRIDLLPSDARAETTKSLIQRWAENDIANATTWVEQLPPGPERDAATESLMHVRFQFDPVAALTEFPREFSELPPARLAGILAGGSIIVSEFGSSGDFASADQVFDLIQLLPSDETRKQFLDSSLWRLTWRSPESAAALVAALPSSQRPENAINDIAGRWADAAPAAAGAWALTLSDDAARRSAYCAVLASWGRVDPDAAARWASSSQDGQLRKDAATFIAGNWAANDPAAAAEWAARIGDAEFRRSATEAIARSWLLNDFESARTWLATVDLPAERKAALRQEARR
ncbi:MAG TPA: hypothetical protein VK178_01335 [Opitutaceae bacterium]|nr:hypothetical protein [Opitutaceae bacterium]